MSDSVRLRRRQPIRLPVPEILQAKNTGVGCHFLLQFMKVKSESEVAQSCLTLSDPMDCSLLGSSVHGIFQARELEWVAIAFSVFVCYQDIYGASQVAQWERIHPPMQETQKTCVQYLGRSHGKVSGNLLQYSCLENFMDREAWQTTVPEVAKSWTQPSMCVYTYTHTTYMIYFFSNQIRLLSPYRYWGEGLAEERQVTYLDSTPISFYFYLLFTLLQTVYVAAVGGWGRRSKFLATKISLTS